MKETEITKRNIKIYKEGTEKCTLGGVPYCKDCSYLFDCCQEHKQTCQRWLEEDKEELIFINQLEKRMKEKNMLLFGFVVRRKGRVLRKIEDKKQTIKLYNKAKI